MTPRTNQAQQSAEHTPSNSRKRRPPRAHGRSPGQTGGCLSELSSVNLKGQNHRRHVFQEQWTESEIRGTKEFGAFAYLQKWRARS